MFNSIFDELEEVKYIKEIKRVEVEAYWEHKRASTIGLSCEYT